MNTGAKRTVIIMFILITLLCGCNSAETSSEKLIKVSKITDLIFADEALVPNPDFSWGMELKDFLANVYGSETMDPNSESFDEQRYFYSEEQNVTTCSPPITYRVKDISVYAEVIYAFNEQGLYMAGYSWVFDQEKIEDAQQCISILSADLNSSSHISAIPFTAPDLSQPEMSVQYSWPLIHAEDQSISLSVSKLLNSYAVTLTVKGI